MEGGMTSRYINVISNRVRRIKAYYVWDRYTRFRRESQPSLSVYFSPTPPLIPPKTKKRANWRAQIDEIEASIQPIAITSRQFGSEYPGRFGPRSSRQGPCATSRWRYLLPKYCTSFHRWPIPAR